jgi:hypothetical protein
MTTSADELRAVAKEAYIYGFPLVDSYRIQHSYFVDKGNREYKGPWNQISSVARVYTPADKAIQTPNSDTPYSALGADLRAEPLVLTLPAIEGGRYFSAQFIDAYTFNFAYLGSRTSGNDGGSFLLAGPAWKGEKPAAIKTVIRCETEFAFVLYRTQLYGVADLERVKAIQAGYKVETLSSFLRQPAPPEAQQVNFPIPLSADQERTSLDFFKELNFVLRFCPTHPSETELMARFAKLGVGPDGTFDSQKLSPTEKKAVSQGIADAWKTFKELKASELDTGKVQSGECFGTREFLKNNYLYRMAAAVLGIYGNSMAEAIYPVYFVDDTGQKLNGSTGEYSLHFRSGQLPPVNAFWSLTMYELPASLLYANSLNRYLINSAMLPSLKREADGGLTLYVQHDSPGAERESNWLPAPTGPFLAVLRLYWPKQEAIDGTWTAPHLRKTVAQELKKAG